MKPVQPGVKAVAGHAATRIAALCAVVLLAALWSRPALPQGGDAVANGSFEADGNPASGWVQDTAKTGNKGTISRDTNRRASGRASLRLQPNDRNGPPQQLAVAQELKLAELRGKQVTLAASVMTEGEARGVAGLLVVSRSGPQMFQLEETAGQNNWALRTRTFELPNDSGARYFVALWVDGRSGSAWFDDIVVAPAERMPPLAAPAPAPAPAPSHSPAPPTAAPPALAGPSRFDPWNPPLGEPVQNLALSEGWTDARVVAAPVNTPGTGGWTDSVTVSRDGRRLYFAYARWDYHTFESSLKFKPTGPARAQRYQGDDMQLYQAELGPEGWVVNHHGGNPSDDLSAGSIGLNETEDVIVFNTYRFKPSYKTAMQMAVRSGSGWVQRGALPEPINSPAGCLDDNGFLLGSMNRGMTLYFESTRRDAKGSKCGKERHLYWAEFKDGNWSEVRPVAGVNSKDEGDNDQQPFVSLDKSQIYWLGSRQAQGKYGLFTADWDGRGYANARMVIGIRTFTAPWANKVVRIGEPNVAVLPQGSVMYFMCGIARGDTWRKAPDDIQYRVCFARKPN